MRSIILSALISFLFTVPINWFVKTLLVEMVFKYTKKLSGDDIDSPSKIQQLMASKAINHLEILKSKLFNHRLTISSSLDVKIFNATWNLVDDDLEVIFKSEGYPNEKSILKDLELVNSDTFTFHPRNISRIEKDNIGIFLVYMLYRDLLSRPHNLILKDKWERNNPRFSTTTIVWKFVGLIIILSIFLFVIVFISYFAINRDKYINIYSVMIYKFHLP
jgi:hypothetical protein